MRTINWLCLFLLALALMPIGQAALTGDAYFIDGGDVGVNGTISLQSIIAYDSNASISYSSEGNNPTSMGVAPPVQSIIDVQPSTFATFLNTPVTIPYLPVPIKLWLILVVTGLVIYKFSIFGKIRR